MSSEQEFEVTGGRVIVDVITMEDDRVGMVFEFHADGVNGVGTALYQQMFRDLQKLQLDKANAIRERDHAHRESAGATAARELGRQTLATARQQELRAQEELAWLKSEHRKLADKYDLEVAAHRENVDLLRQAEVRLRTISQHFMHLHDIAKDVVGPKIKVADPLPHYDVGTMAEPDRTMPGRAQLADLGE